MTILERRKLKAAGLVATLAAPIAAINGSARAATYTAGDLVIYRVGDGSAALSNAGTAVFLDQYATGGTLVSSQGLSTANGGNSVGSLVASGSATSEGLLSLSTNGQALLVTGYQATIGTTNNGTSIAGTSSTTVPREFGAVDANGNVTLTTVGTSFNGNNIRTAASADGSNVFVGGAISGIGQTTVGSNATPTLVSGNGVANFRQLGLANNQVFASSSSANFVGVNLIANNTATLITAAGTTASPYGFTFATETAGGTAPDTLYVADTGSNTTGSKILKYSFNPTTDATTLVGTFAPGNTSFPTGATGLTAIANGSTETLYVTTPTTLYSFVDASGAGVSDANGTLAALATAGTNEAFRGVAFAPSLVAAPEPASLLLAGLAAAPLTLGRRRRRTA